jgi:RecB family endonuclease NucS
MRETLMQKIIIKYPSEVLNEEGLTFVDREVTTGNRRLDIVLKDRMGRMILLEAQIGNLDTNHIDRHIDFVEGFLSKHPDVDIRVMYVAFTIDPLRKKFVTIQRIL